MHVYVRVRGGAEGRGERPCPRGHRDRRRCRRRGRRKVERCGTVPVCGLTGSMVQRDLAFRLTLILEPNRDGFHFPVTKCALVASSEMQGGRTCLQLVRLLRVLRALDGTFDERAVRAS